MMLKVLKAPLVIALALAAVLYHVGLAVADDLLLFAIVSSVILYAGCILAAEARLKRLVSPLALFALLTLVHFCMPGTLMALGWDYSFYNEQNSPYAVTAMLFVLGMLVSMHLGVWSVAYWYRAEAAGKRFETAIDWQSGGVLAVCGVLIAMGWVTRAYVIHSHAYFQFARAVQGELEGPFFAAIRMVELFPMHALFIIAIHAYSPSQLGSDRWKRILHGAMLMELIYWMPTGRKEETILIFLMPMLIRYLRTRQLPSLSRGILFVAFVAVLFPIAYYYRYVSQYAALANGDLTSAVSMSVEVLNEGAAEEVAEDKDAEDLLLERLDLLESMSACIRLIEQGEWELRLGYDYGIAVLALIPRVFWKSKPDFHYGTEFGHAAGLLANHDWFTSISVSFPGEAFLNFSWFGWLVFVLIGAAYALLYESARYSRWGSTCCLLYAVTLPTILFIGGTFALYIGGLVKLLPFYLCLSWLMRRSFEILPPVSTGAAVRTV
jgi:hypothetical protein